MHETCDLKMDDDSVALRVIHVEQAASGDEFDKLRCAVGRMKLNKKRLLSSKNHLCGINNSGSAK
jgi:hypothetical protein